MDFRDTALTDLAGRVRSKELSARELVGHALERIETVDKAVHAFVRVDGDRAMTEAAAVDEAIAAGKAVGPLAGIPIGVKDLEDAKGFVTSHGSALWADGPPAGADSVLVGRLRAAGCVVVGKTNTPELGWKADTDNSTFGPTSNPWNLEHSPGGSSGGSAAAIAAGLVPLATGSDGGGSIRIPSSCCGLSGMKPSLGRVPSGGAEAPDWHDLSTRGPMARRFEDIVAALAVAVGPDPSDLRSMPRPDVPWSGALAEPKVPARVAWSPTLGYAPVDREVLTACESALRVLESLGAEIVVVDEVFDEDPVGPWLTLASTYNLRSLEPHRGSPAWEKVDPLLVAMADNAASKSPIEIVQALDECYRMNAKLVQLFRDVRLLLTPTCAGSPPPRSAGGAGFVNGDLDFNWVRFTYPFNLTRSPAGTVCVGRSEAGLPIGLQLVGPQHGDIVVLRSATALEAAIGFEEVAPI